MRFITSSLMPPWSAQLDDRVALGVEQLAPQPLIGLRALLDRAVVPVVEARREAVARKR